MQLLFFAVVLLICCSLSGARRGILYQCQSLLCSTGGGADCIDGVCDVKPINSSSSSSSDDGDAGKIVEVTKMGWEEKDARRALKASGGDVEDALNFLS